MVKHKPLSDSATAKNVRHSASPPGRLLVDRGARLGLAVGVTSVPAADDELDDAGVPPVPPADTSACCST